MRYIFKFDPSMDYFMAFIIYEKSLTGRAMFQGKCDRMYITVFMNFMEYLMSATT